MFLVQGERCPSPRGQQGTGSSDFSWNFPAGCAERCLESCPCQCPVGAESHQTLALGFKNTKILQSSSNTSFPFKDRKEELSFLRPGPVSALGSGCPALAKPTGFIFQHRLELSYSSSFPARERGVALAGAPDLKPQLRFWLPFARRQRAGRFLARPIPLTALCHGCLSSPSWLMSAGPSLCWWRSRGQFPAFAPAASSFPPGLTGRSELSAWRCALCVRTVPRCPRTQLGDVPAVWGPPSAPASPPPRSLTRLPASACARLAAGLPGGFASI